MVTSDPMDWISSSSGPPRGGYEVKRAGSTAESWARGVTGVHHIEMEIVLMLTVRVGGEDEGWG